MNALTRSSQLWLLCVQRLTNSKTGAYCFQLTGYHLDYWKKCWSTYGCINSIPVYSFLSCFVQAESLSYIQLPHSLLSVPLSKIRLKLSLYETVLVLFCHWRKAPPFRLLQISIVLAQSNPMSQACLGRWSVPRKARWALVPISSAIISV